MKKITNLFSKVVLTVLAFFGLNSAANAQCPGGQVEVSIDVTTDAWGYELYWELVPSGDSCGSPNAIGQFGNPNVGCGGGGLQVAAGGAGYASNATATEGPFCLVIGQDYDILAVDDWGDGGHTFTSQSQGFSFNMPAGTSNDTYTFTASLTPDYNLVAGSQVADPNGWTLDYMRPINDRYYPLSQLTAAEASMGITVANFGLNNATGAYVRLNIDLDNGGTYTNVFTDTMHFGTIQKDSVVFQYKAITDTTWYALGDYRYQYIVYQDSTDGAPASDTITDVFTIADDFWSRVEQANGFPFGTQAYFPGTQSFIDMYEWGSFFYMPTGSSYVLDTFKTVFFHSSSATALDAPYQVRIYRVSDLNANQTFDFPDDLLLEGLGVDTVPINPGNISFAEVSTFFDAATGGAYQFADGELYYIAIYQESQSAPYLSDGTVRNGLFPYGQIFNHDFSIYGNSNAYPFYNALTISEGFTPSSYTYGWTGGPEPSFSLKLRNIVTSSKDVERVELKNVTVMPNPTSDIINVSVELENMSDVKYIMTGMSGRVINYVQAADVTSEVRTFDISHLPAGVYLLNVISNEGSTTKRIVKK